MPTLTVADLDAIADRIRAELLPALLAELRPAPQRPRLSRGELADLLGVSVKTIRQRELAGLIPKPARCGRSVSWSRNEIDAWLASGAPRRSAWERARDRTEARL
ncbi:MAG: hypothetical protein M3552_03175 [Planctomycetota bacterium]|nr:hypothetical protein [Planctomycetota bacterium]